MVPQRDRCPRTVVLCDLCALCENPASVPVTFAAIIALLPLWSMIERRYGIESVGHSGPSDWCFWVVFGVYLFVAALVALGVRRPARQS